MKVDCELIEDLHAGTIHVLARGAGCAGAGVGDGDGVVILTVVIITVIFIIIIIIPVVLSTLQVTRRGLP